MTEFVASYEVWQVLDLLYYGSVLSIILLLCIVFSSAITEGPVSRIALVGQTIQFHCAGTGNDLAWKVDEFIGNNPNVLR